MAGSSKVSDRLAPNDRPFPFLDLPKEIRLMVYEWLPVTTRHHAMQSKFHGKYSQIILVKRAFSSVTILATCRLIRDEAAPVLAPKLRYISSQPMQYIVDADCCIRFLSHLDGVLAMIIETTLELNRPEFSHGYARTYGHDWLIDSIHFASKCIAWQHKKRSIKRGVWADTEIVLRLAPHHQELPENGTADLEWAIESFLEGMEGVDNIYFGTVPLDRPRLFAKLDGQDEECWNKLVDYHTGPEGLWLDWSLPTMDDETWKKEWAEGEVL